MYEGVVPTDLARVRSVTCAGAGVCLLRQRSGVVGIATSMSVRSATQSAQRLPALESHRLSCRKVRLTHVSAVVIVSCVDRASDFPFQKKQFSVSKKVKFRFGSVSLLATLNSMKSQYIERKCGERTVKMAQLVG